MRPMFRIEADGKDVTATLRDRVIKLEVTDEAGMKSDRLSLSLDARPTREGGRVAMPKIGTVLAVFLGYEKTGAVRLGAFKVDEIKYSGPPETLAVRARAADTGGAFRSEESRSWDDTTIGAIVSAIAGEHGYEPRVADNLAAVKIVHEDQTAESPWAFLTRLVAVHDGVVKAAEGKLVVAPKGEAKTVSGADLPPLSVAIGDLSSWSYTYAARKDAGAATGDTGTKGKGGTKSVYWDADAGKMKAITVGEPPYQTTKFTTADKARAAAEAAAAKNKSDRAKGTLEATMPGNPRLAAERKMVLLNARPGVPTAWRIETATHSYGASGFTTKIKAEVFQETQEDVAAKAAEASE